MVPAPVVGVLSTGDELVEGGGALLPGQIRDSNRRTLMALLRRDGFVAVDLGIAPDVEGEIERRLAEGAARCDAVLTSGGVSMGDFDLVKVVLDRIGRMHWMQVAIRPAKPFAFGLVGDTPVFGLPGNPVSSMVSYEVLARPGLRRMAGRADVDLRRVPVPSILDEERIARVRRRADLVRPGPGGGRRRRPPPCAQRRRAGVPPAVCHGPGRRAGHRAPRPSGRFGRDCARTGPRGRRVRGWLSR